MPPDITILPQQATRIAEEASKAGAAIGVSQFGSCLVIDNGQSKFVINAGGHDIPPATQEVLPC